MGALSRKIKNMENNRAEERAARIANNPKKFKAADPRKRCGCGANLANMTETHAAQHVARCID